MNGFDRLKTFEIATWGPRLINNCTVYYWVVYDNLIEIRLQKKFSALSQVPHCNAPGGSYFNFPEYISRNLWQSRKFLLKSLPFTTRLISWRFSWSVIGKIVQRHYTIKKGGRYGEGQILIFQNTFLSACDEIRLEILESRKIVHH
jgi:hypothetical protein